MNDRRFVASPLDDGRDPADFAPETISNIKPNGNMLINRVRSLIFYGHDSLFPTPDSSVFREQSLIRHASDPIISQVESRVKVCEVD